MELKMVDGDARCQLMSTVLDKRSSTVDSLNHIRPYVHVNDVTLVQLFNGNLFAL